MTTFALEHAAQSPMQWAAVDKCPACGSRFATSRGAIPDLHYAFGAARVPIPVPGITVMECHVCGLLYKSPVPDPAFLAAVFEREGVSKWMAQKGWALEVEAVRRLARRLPFDLLDVGAAGGEFLAACAASGVARRRSALDVLRYPGVDAHLAGEFISGRLDADRLAWSEEPYDVVTVFDVLEHLYDPQAAFANLRSLVKQGGVAVIETGCADNFWPVHFGINQWWYVRLIEHHIFWSREPLERCARANGFRVIAWEERRHKSRQHVGVIGISNDLLEVGLYWVARSSYTAIARVFGKQGNQPWFPFARDHFRACLRRI